MYLWEKKRCIRRLTFPDWCSTVPFVETGPQQRGRVLCEAESNWCGRQVREENTPYGRQARGGRGAPMTATLGQVRLGYGKGYSTFGFGMLRWVRWTCSLDTVEGLRRTSDAFGKFISEGYGKRHNEESPCIPGRNTVPSLVNSKAQLTQILRNLKKNMHRNSFQNSAYRGM